MDKYDGQTKGCWVGRLVNGCINEWMGKYDRGMYLLKENIMEGWMDGYDG